MDDTKVEICHKKGKNTLCTAERIGILIALLQLRRHKWTVRILMVVQVVNILFRPLFPHSFLVQLAPGATVTSLRSLVDLVRTIVRRKEENHIT